MANHTLHPDVTKHGLADDCPRCTDHALEPWNTLDYENLGILVRRILHHESGRSHNETTAMMNLLRKMHNKYEMEIQSMADRISNQPYHRRPHMEPY